MSRLFAPFAVTVFAALVFACGACAPENSRRSASGSVAAKRDAVANRRDGSALQDKNAPAISLKIRDKPLKTHVPPSSWNLGYWIWNVGDPSYDESALAPETGEPGSEARPLDTLYVNLSEAIDPMYGIDQTFWPADIPKAKRYMIVWRHPPLNRSRLQGRELVPDVRAIPILLRKYLLLKKSAQHAGDVLAGFQVDFDCPTEALDAYAAFLSSLRDALPQDDTLSITALLDWFRPGTQISSVLENVDEFVPQFYDIDVKGWETGSGIAHPIETTRWAPIFNRYKTPYRIGISTFGRLSEVSHGSHRRVYYSDLTPLSLATKKELALHGPTRTPAGELKLVYAAKERSAELFSFSQDTQFEVLLPTAESVHSAFRAAQSFGGYCAGVLFFRWPVANEGLVLTPPEVQEITRKGMIEPRQARVEAEDGLCATVHCSDLVLEIGDRFAGRKKDIWIHSSEDLEYFLPEKEIPCEVVAARLLHVIVPAHPAVRRVLLGRAVTLDRATYSAGERQAGSGTSRQ